MKTLACYLTLIPGILLAVDSPGQREDWTALKQAALKVDQSVANFYRQKKLPVPAVTDDATFLRRAFLVSIGRIPTMEEARAFLEIDEPQKREELVHYLLRSKGYSSHMTNWAFDLLRMADTGNSNNSTMEPYRHWVRTAIHHNMPWDQMVQKLLSSQGDGWSQETAAVGYYTRDRGMPLDNLANSMRVFLGSRMECAQCHDDPFGKTERHDFYRLAAFTHGQGTLGQQYMSPLWNELQDKRHERGQEYAIAQILWDKIYASSLSGGGTGRIALPSDYQYRDGRPGEVVGAKTPFGKSARMSEKKDGNDGRKEFAEWVTTKNVEQFPSVIANRMWKRVMGKGFYEPIDEFIPAKNTQSPELMQHLVRTMVELKYNLRDFQHVLMLTKTFQFATNPNPSTVEAGDDFHGRKIERLSSEQIWDSLITLAGGDPDKKPMRSLDDRIYLGGRPVLVGKKSMSQLSQEVLALQSEKEVRSYFTKFVNEVKSGGGGGGGDDSMMAMAPVQRYDRDAQVRASELPSPAPRSHFLYLFGQSERAVVEGASRDPNVGQVLSLMNGFVQRQLVNNPDAHLYKGLKGAKSDEEKIRRIYIAILNRPPNSEEMSWMKEEIKVAGEDGLRNIVSALVMSSEFLFLQ
jgi:hypothetical protein